MNFKVESENVGRRLDIFLVEQDSDKSRAQWQKLVKSGAVEVNGKNVGVSYRVKEEDEVVISNFKFQISNVVASHEGWTEDINKVFGEPEVICEEDDFVVVVKPAGMPVHRDNKYRKETLVDWVVEKWPEIGEVGDTNYLSPSSSLRDAKNRLATGNSVPPPKKGGIARGTDDGVDERFTNDRPGIVQRLDKDVSGLIVIARTPKGFEHLKKQWQERKVEKEYKALVYGKVELDEGEIKLPIVRNKERGLFVARTNVDDVFALEDEGAKEAVTVYNVESRWINYTLLNVKILTGRTHQIRVHLRAIGHSIVGDKLYATRDIRKKVKKIELDRIWLHAWRLAFRDLNGEWREFEAEVPEELRRVLGTIK